MATGMNSFLRGMDSFREVRLAVMAGWARQGQEWLLLWVGEAKRSKTREVALPSCPAGVT